MVILIVGFLFPACSGQMVKSIKTYQTKGIYHRVKSGETLYLIARAYNVSVQELAEANNIQDPGRIEADSVIFVPDASQAIDDIIATMDARRPATGAVLPIAGQAVVKQPQEGDRAPVKPPVRKATIQPRTEVLSGAPTIRIKPGKVLERFRDASQEEGKGTAPGSEKGPAAQSTDHASIPVQKLERANEQAAVSQSIATGEPPSGRERSVESPPSKAEAETLQFDRKRFVWPVKGKVVSRFGIQPSGMYYNGITIAAGEDMPVVAAAGGTVIFSGPLKDYGETIIIKHEEHYATVYTRLGQRKVKIDDRVKQAEMIGYLGKGEEKGGGPRLNFEIRYHNKARNPMFFLP
ncbi:MAG: M23 family metallopeptidase [Pseudomonadota bacterium]